MHTIVKPEFQREAHALGVAEDACPQLHVLFVIDELLEMGGAERALMSLIRLLNTAGYRTSAVTFRADYSLELVRQFPCPLQVLPLRRTYDLPALRVAREIREFIRREHVDIVHTFFETSDLWGGLVAKSCGNVALISSRRDMGILRGRKHRLAYRLLNGMFDQVHTVSESVREFCIREDHLVPDRVTTAYNGVRDRLANARPRTDVRASLRLDDSQVVISTVGHIRQVKGIDILIEAAAEIVREFPRAVFVVAGDDHEPAHFRQLQTMVKAKGLEEHVRFIGSQEDVTSILAASDIFLLPSRSEGFSNALVEAMMCKLPCVATDVGGNREAVENGVNGFLIESESHQEMATAVRKLLLDPELSAAMGSASRKIAMEKFSESVFLQKMDALYHAALGRRDSR